MIFGFRASSASTMSTGPLIDIELRDGGVRPQRAEVGQQIAQPERGVDILRVERGQNNISHRDSQLTSAPDARQWSSG